MLTIKIYLKSTTLLLFQLLVIIKTKISKLRGKKIILYCGQVHSPHFKSFISQLQKNKPHYYITACTFPYNNLDLKHSIYDISLSNLFLKKNDLNNFLARIYNLASNPIFGIKKQLTFLINFLKPDIIWFHELQSSTCAINLDKLNYSPIIYVTTYGNDITFFIDVEKHKVLIENLINKIKLFHIETLREKNILLQKGYKNEIVIGSATLSEFKDNYPFLPRFKNIDFLIKGGNSYRGSSSSIYELLKNDYTKFLGYNFVIFDCDEYDKFKFNRLKEKFNLNILVLERLDKSIIQTYLSESKFLFINSYSDGMSNLVYESWINRCCVVTTFENGFSELYSKNASEKLLFNIVPNYDYFINLIAMYDQGLFNSILDEQLYLIRQYYSDNVKKELSKFLV